MVHLILFAVALYDQNKIDIEVIDGCKKGIRKHQEMLYKYLYGYAFNISKLYTYSREEAEDVMNESFLKLFNSFHKYDSKLSIKSWIRKIIINTAIDSFRKNIKHLGLLDISEIELSDIDDKIISKLNFDEIIEALNQLPESHRLVFNLHEIQGFKHNEIAEQLNISVSSSRVFLMRAKNKLKNVLTKNFSGKNEK